MGILNGSKNLAIPDLEGKEYLGNGVYVLVIQNGGTLTYNVFNGEYRLFGNLTGTLFYDFGYVRPSQDNSYIQMWKTNQVAWELTGDIVGFGGNSLYNVSVNKNKNYDGKVPLALNTMQIYTYNLLGEIDVYFKLQLEKGTTATGYGVPKVFQDGVSTDWLENQNKTIRNQGLLRLDFLSDHTNTANTNVFPYHENKDLSNMRQIKEIYPYNKYSDYSGYVSDFTGADINFEADLAGFTLDTPVAELDGKTYREVFNDDNIESKNLAMPDLEGKEYLGDGWYETYSDDTFYERYNINTGEFLRDGETNVNGVIHTVYFKPVPLGLTYTSKLNHLSGEVINVSNQGFKLPNGLSGGQDFLYFNHTSNVTNIRTYVANNTDIRLHINSTNVIYNNYTFTVQTSEGEEASDYQIPYIKGYKETLDYHYDRYIKLKDSKFDVPLIEATLNGIPYRYVQTTSADFNASGNYTGTESYIILPLDKPSGYKIVNPVVIGVATNGDYLTNASEMFRDNPNLYLELEYLDTSNVTNMQAMFRDSQATTLDLGSFDTSKVTNMWDMFLGTKVTTLDLSNFDTSNVTTMRGMFYQSKATTLDLSSFDTSNVTIMRFMFNQAQATTIDVSSFDTSNVYEMHSMFLLSQATTLDLSSFDTGNVTVMGNMFEGAITTTGYARTQTDADNFNSSSGKPAALVFEVSQSPIFNPSPDNTYHGEADTPPLLGITIKWSEFGGHAIDYAVENNGKRDVYFGNKERKVFVPLSRDEGTEKDVIKISVLRWSDDDSPVTIERIFMGLHLEYNQDKIFGFNKKQFNDVLSLELPQEEINFELSNIDRKFDPLWYNSYYNYLSDKTEVRVYHGYKLDSGDEYIKGGTFYLDDWQAPNNDITATFTARDILSILDVDEKFSRAGSLPMNELAGIILGREYTGTGGDKFRPYGLPVNPDGSRKWNISQTTLTRIPLELQTKRNVLQMIAHANQLQLQTDDDANLSFVDTLKTGSLSAPRKILLTKPEFEILPPVKKITAPFFTFGVSEQDEEVASFEVEAGDTVEVDHTGNYYGGYAETDNGLIIDSENNTWTRSYSIDLAGSGIGNLKIFRKALNRSGSNLSRDVRSSGVMLTYENELIKDKGQAQDVLDRAYRELDNSRLVSFELRIDPRFKIGNIVSFPFTSMGFEQIEYMRIDELEITYEGAYKGLIKGAIVSDFQGELTPKAYVKHSDEAEAGEENIKWHLIE